MEGTSSMRDTPGGADGERFEPDVPARLDRLPCSRFHWRVVIALGITWVLDGIEITVPGAIGARLTEAGTLHFTAGQIGFAASVYLFGEVIGALYFGRLADKL